MYAALSDRYAEDLTAMEHLVAEEIARSPLADLPELEKLVRHQLDGEGKQLRPLLSLAVADLTGGPRARVHPVAAAVELYHRASLILDDIQDNSDFRRGERTIHTTVGVGMAFNVAGIIRSMSYHVVDRSPELRAEDKLRIHRCLDTTAIRLYIGQSIDLGWHEGWYPTYEVFPYDQMIAHKTGALFGCAAWIGACAAGGDPRLAESFGTHAGILYQLFDDFDDVFTRDGDVHSDSQDLRYQKPTAPILTLLTVLAETGNARDILRITRWLSGMHGQADEDTAWIVRLLAEHGVAERLQRRLSQMAERLLEQAHNLAAGEHIPGEVPGIELLARAVGRS
ncbi:polyprenyl synthetase family protein [Nonomuraea sp. SMC257]|uniref:Polyprenyl synthetase family protein n=1 Tax=Nonomuraea montanisoli TaxID=2741721 RepID=A0A7Y6M5R1_9ACTN|nr:polyprenyl synthetase family protein [Nonomuraea montanisoli]NUW35567.1 polyprenyl synthetase family protein [Nonomuraea montanisoli]